MTTALGSNEGGQGTPPPSTGTTPPPATGTPPPAASWRDSLPDDLKNDVGLQQFNDVANLAKSWRSAQEMVGKKGVIIPGEKATPEEFAKFYKDLGQPELDKYTLATPKESKLNEDFLKTFRETAHKAGLLPKQAQGLLDWYLSQEQGFSDKAKADHTAEATKAINGLKTEWGQGYDKQIGLAKAAIREFGSPELVTYLNESGLGNDPQLIRLMAKAGAMLGEDKIRGDGGSGKFGKTPVEIQREINDVMGNPAHPYFDVGHPGHKQAIADMESRYKGLTQTA